MKIKLFWKENCPRCPTAKAMMANFNNVEHHNIEEVDGLAEASFYGVMSTPSVVVVDDVGKEVSAWYGEVPPLEDLRKCLRQ